MWGTHKSGHLRTRALEDPVLMLMLQTRGVVMNRGLSVPGLDKLRGPNGQTNIGIRQNMISSILFGLDLSTRM